MAGEFEHSLEESIKMKALIFLLLLGVCFFPFASCGQDGKGMGELCASNDDCESGTCGFGPCPSSGPACAEGKECTCLVCL
jgi:hypothetical protein